MGTYAPPALRMPRSARGSQSDQLQHHANQLISLHPPLLQGVRQLVRLTIELMIRQTGFFVHERHRIRRPLHLRLQQRRQATMQGLWHLGGVPVHQDPLPFLSSEQRQMGNGTPCIRDYRLQEHLPMPQQALDRCLLKQVGVILQGAEEALTSPR